MIDPEQLDGCEAVIIPLVRIRVDGLRTIHCLLLLPNSLPGHIPTQYFGALAPDEAVIVSASTTYETSCDRYLTFFFLTHEPKMDSAKHYWLIHLLKSCSYNPFAYCQVSRLFLVLITILADFRSRQSITTVIVRSHAVPGWLRCQQLKHQLTLGGHTSNYKQPRTRNLCSTA